MNNINLPIAIVRQMIAAQNPELAALLEDAETEADFYRIIEEYKTTHPE